MIGCIIQARIGSTRLPGKSMKKINGEVPMLKFLLDQLLHTELIDKIVVATTNSPNDDKIFNFCKSIGVSCFRGESQDVLDRHYQCAKQYKFSTVVRITSDNPLSDPDIIDTIITKFNLSNYDYITNEKPPTFPLGYAVEVFSFTSLEKAWKEATLPSEREHVTPYFYNNRNMFKQENYTNNEDLSNIRCTVDTMPDFILIEKIISRIRNRPIHLSEVLQLFSNEPSLLEINKDIKHDGYERSLEDDKKFLRNKLIDDGDN